MYSCLLFTALCDYVHRNTFVCKPQLLRERTVSHLLDSISLEQTRGYVCVWPQGGVRLCLPVTLECRPAPLSGHNLFTWNLMAIPTCYEW